MNEEPGLNPAALARLRELGGAPFVRQMLGLFLELAREKITAARAAEQVGDLAGIEKAVHPLGSSSGNVGAMAMLALARRIEQLARDRKPDEIPGLLCELEASFAQLQPQLEKERDAAGA